MAKFRIVDICKEKGITQKALAEKIGLSPIGLAKAISGNPTFETLEKIASGLDVDVTTLIIPPTNTIICPKCGTVLEVKEKTDK